MEGRWSDARSELETAETILRERCSGVSWEIGTTTGYQFRSLMFLGRYDEIRRRIPALVKQARERGDLYALTSLHARFNWLAALAQDEPEAAFVLVARALRHWSQKGFHVQHYWHLSGVVETALYRDEPAEAWKSLEERWSALTGSLLLRVQFTRTEATHLRARAALAAAAQAAPQSEEFDRLVRVVTRCIAAIENERLVWADPWALLLKAGLGTMTGEHSRARGHARDSVEGFENAKMLGYALGRGLTLEDECVVEQLVDRLRQEDYRAHALILGIVESIPFRYKAGTSGAAVDSDVSPTGEK